MTSQDTLHDNPSFEVIEGPDDAGVLFLCDHATNTLPAAYGTLGLPPEAFARHIAWDIGAAEVTRRLAQRFRAPAVLTRFSRLLIDPNRGADDPTLVMRISDGAIVPGNARIDAAEIEHRRRVYWQPYRDAVSGLLDSMTRAGPVPAIVSVHSFTPAWRGVPRPWEIAVLWDSDPRLPVPLMDALAREGIVVGDNEPYDGALEGDTMDAHGNRRGLANVLVEFRQDLVATREGAHAWAARFAGPLAQALAASDIHAIRHHPSRAGPRPAFQETSP